MNFFYTHKDLKKQAEKLLSHFDIGLEAFEIENCDKLTDPNYVVSHIDNDTSNNNINNLKIVTKADIGSINGKKSRQSELFQEKINWTIDHYKDDNIKTISIN